MTFLDRLENRSIHVLREAYAAFGKDLAMLWSMGKDSTALVWMARKAFLGRIPFPLIHIDTSFKIPDMIAYRDRMAREWGLDLIVGQNEAALAGRRTFPDGAVSRLACCRLLKTEALRDTLNGSGPRKRLDPRGNLKPWRSRRAFHAVIAAIRADEEGSRSKERYFSPRSEEHYWDPAEQPPEFWNLYNVDFKPGTHVRVHPLLEWREADVWEYVARENIPLVGLYYDRGDGRRYRSLGCGPCTLPIESDSKTPTEIVSELKTGRLKDVAERSGRAQDDEDRGTLEGLRREGYM